MRLSPPFSEPANQPVTVQGAVEEIRDVVKKQERELDDLRARMRDSVSERPICTLGPSMKDVRKIFGFLDPSPFVRI